jgi:hypothetical protein
MEDKWQALAAVVKATRLLLRQWRLLQQTAKGHIMAVQGCFMAYGDGALPWYSYARVRCGAQEVCWQLVDTAIGTEVSRLQAHPPACVTSTW